MQPLRARRNGRWTDLQPLGPTRSGPGSNPGFHPCPPRGHPSVTTPGRGGPTGCDAGTRITGRRGPVMGSAGDQPSLRLIPAVALQTGTGGTNYGNHTNQEAAGQLHLKYFGLILALWQGVLEKNNAMRQIHTESCNTFRGAHDPRTRNALRHDLNAILRLPCPASSAATRHAPTGPCSGVL